MLHLTYCIIHMASYILNLTNCALHIVSYTLHLTHCILHIPSYTLHLTYRMLHLKYRILHIASYTLHYTTHLICCILHITSYTLHLKHCILHIASYPLHLTHCILHIASHRVSHNTVSTFVFLIPWLPRGVEIPSWTFFNSPFCVDFDIIQFFIILWNSDQWQNTTRRSFEKLTFFVYCTIEQFVTHELLWALKSTHVRSWALMSTHKYGAMAQWAIKSNDEYPWLHGTMLMLMTVFSSH